MSKEKIIKSLEYCRKNQNSNDCQICEYGGRSFQICERLADDILVLLRGQEEIVHPEPSCEMTYITDCCCDLCGVQLIREDNFCRCCGKRIKWEGR